MASCFLKPRVNLSMAFPQVRLGSWKSMTSTTIKCPSIHANQNVKKQTRKHDWHWSWPLPIPSAGDSPSLLLKGLPNLSRPMSFCPSHVPVVVLLVTVILCVCVPERQQEGRAFISECHAINHDSSWFTTKKLWQWYMVVVSLQGFFLFFLSVEILLLDPSPSPLQTSGRIFQSCPTKKTPATKWLDVVDIVEVVVRVKEEVVVVSLEDDVLATNSLTLQEGMSEQPSQKWVIDIICRRMCS